MRFNKYHNKKVEVDGEKFDSQKEYKRWLVLKELEAKKQIIGLERQKRFQIVPKTELVNRARFYVADFFYYDENDFPVIEDVKSPITIKDPVYTLKRDLVKWQYPDIDFREIL